MSWRRRSWRSSLRRRSRRPAGRDAHAVHHSSQDQRALGVGRDPRRGVDRPCGNAARRIGKRRRAPRRGRPPRQLGGRAAQVCGRHAHRPPRSVRRGQRTGRRLQHPAYAVPGRRDRVGDARGRHPRPWGRRGDRHPPRHRTVGHRDECAAGRREHAPLHGPAQGHRLDRSWRGAFFPCSEPSLPA